MDLTRNCGICTLKGSEPLGTPYRSVPGLVITVAAIKPTILPPLLIPSSIVACTLTEGETCCVSEFRKSNVPVQAVPALVPGDDAVSTSCPKLCVHAPTLPSRPDDDAIGKVGESAV